MTDVVEVDGVEFEVEDSNNMTPEETADIDAYFKKANSVDIPEPDVGPDVKKARALPEPGFPAEFQRFSKAMPFMPEMRPERESFAMAGGMVGGHYGKALGPHGMEKGAVAGAMTGSVLHDLVDDVVRNIQNAPPRPGSGTLDTLGRAAKEGAWELGGSTFAHSLKYPMAGAKKVGQWVAGVGDPMAKHIASLATEFGVPAGLVHATKRDVLKGATRVAAVLPFVGGSLRENRKAFGSRMGQWVVDTLDTLAPTRTMATLGTEYTEAAMKRFEKVSDLVAAKYQVYYNLARTLPDPNIVPTTSMKKMAKKILADFDNKQVELVSGEMEKAPRSEVIDYLREVLQYPTKISPDQYRDKMIKMRDLVATDVSKEVSGATNWGGNMKSAMEADWLSPAINFSGKKGKAVMKALKDANNFFHSSMKEFETPTAKAFGRVEKGIFDAQASFKDFASAASNDDTVAFFNALFNNKSVKGLRQLRNIVGEDKFLMGSRAWIESALKKSAASENTLVNNAKRLVNEQFGTHIDEGFMFDSAKLRKNLGLDTEDGAEALNEMLKGTGVDARKWNRFIDLTESAEGFKIPSASVFIQRRVTLGGISALYSTAKLGQRSKSAAIMALGLMRGGANLLVNPEALQTMTKAFDDSIPHQERRKAVIRFMRHALGYNASESDEPTKADLAWADKAADALNEANGLAEEAVDSIPDSVTDLIGSFTSSTWEKINQALE